VLVQQRAGYVGGLAALRREVQSQLTYPTNDVAERRQGTVYVTGTVPAAGGKLQDPKVQYSLAPAFDEEALRVVKQLKHFTPYKEDGKALPSSYTVPVVFELVDGKLITAEALQKRADSRVYTYVEQMPQFQGGGNAAMQDYIRKELRLPEEVKSGKVEGKVFVQFTVSEDGILRDTKVLKGISEAADAEALRVVKTMQFEAGKQNGQYVNVSYTVPVVFVSPNHIYEARELTRRSEFPGGDTALRDYLTKNQQEPAIVKSENLQGYVTVRFVVQPDGRIATPVATNSLCRSCDEEALRVVKAMPAWVPGQLSEKNVPSYQEVQVRFGNRN
jgi:TonB family protein